MEKEVHHDKELVIKLKVNQLRKFFFFILMFMLIGVIVFQFYNPNCKRCDCTASFQEDNLTDNLTEESLEIKDDSLEIVDEKIIEAVIENVSNDSVKDIEEDIEDKLLPITGDVFLSIDDIEYVIKDSDYARITYVTFTIKNQDVDFSPRIKAFLTSDTDDVKDISLDTLKAGKSITVSEPKLTFGYKDISDSHTLKLELYKGSTLLKTSTKVFETN